MTRAPGKGVKVFGFGILCPGSGTDGSNAGRVRADSSWPYLGYYGHPRRTMPRVLGATPGGSPARAAMRSSQEVTNTVQMWAAEYS